MRQRLFKQVDVFTAQPYLGNPLAVVLDGSDLSTEDMQAFARWTNLSETTFLLPPSPEAATQGADYRVRIFTPGDELPFAGHPTLGSCHAWLQAGGVPQTAGFIVQECAKGLVKLRRDGTRLAFAAPSLQRSAPDAALLAQVAAALGLQSQQILGAQWLNNGPTWLGLLLDSMDTVLQLQPDAAALKGLVPGVGVAGMDIAPAAPDLIVRSNREARAFGARDAAASPGDDDTPSVEVRFFAPDIGVLEDPVTGSFNASLAQWLIADGIAPPRYVAAQGTCIGRAGRVYIEQDDAGQVWVGGDSVTCIDGKVTL
ncbi:PhzF family phenazine biosynthesis protein [Rhodoferax saidenbachensis]|uniref:PhzF family phenazine biosynthesis protein n=1 Tax=Rhodoferax saidenbachensis TaxID=1484693 RepID=A0ABU1ZSV6_9BURK|nr:PhzF family phenazine biosynthesis protein [Rhodoferax saidenbachensis]MDR7308573.1 PhzF family phenazine biosynthesis protein [Rhodoferax saidenbachensis]